MNELTRGPLWSINEQCRQNEGKLLKRIRIHPQDWPILKEELIRFLGAQQVDHITIGSIPVVKDPDLKEGPVCEWF